MPTFLHRKVVRLAIFFGGVVGNDETPAGEGLRRDPTGSANDRGGLPAPPQESELFPTTP